MTRVNAMDHVDQDADVVGINNFSMYLERMKYLA
jgi:hypothetical protein